jgi:A/G-specific adenine glycosylase
MRHVFTHFELTLTLRIARVPADAAPARGRFVDPDDFSPRELPTVMRKAFDMGRGAFDQCAADAQER